MYYTTPTRFFNEEFQAVKEFIKDDKGNILGYTRTVGDKEFPIAKKSVTWIPSSWQSIF
ncbi:MAG: hypothetical protein IPO07_18340 [Haliscomenobacter sp.]|nr:hypothetical protein [Haliscomenobacter sp.]MBK9490516.1 hypothetical protein [Haliscomenobacter sp.]